MFKGLGHVGRVRLCVYCENQIGYMSNVKLTCGHAGDMNSVSI